MFLGDITQRCDDKRASNPNPRESAHTKLNLRIALPTVNFRTVWATRAKTNVFVDSADEQPMKSRPHDHHAGL
jgi:hypothetical protein